MSSADDHTDHLAELDRTKSQLLIFAKEISTIYQRERRQAKQLEEMMDHVRDDYMAVIRTLAMVVEAKDEYTRYHLERCQEYGMALAREVMPDQITADLEYGFLLHDIGKIGIPEAILSKPSGLDPDEIRVMQMHPLIGVQIVTPMRKVVDDVALEVIRSHHERFDGTGYPDGLAGDDIPIGARVFSVVDAFDAMTTDRPYRRALSVDTAARRIREGSGTQFDPHVVDVFSTMLHRMELRPAV